MQFKSFRVVALLLGVLGISALGMDLPFFDEAQGEQGVPAHLEFDPKVLLGEFRQAQKIELSRLLAAEKALIREQKAAQASQQKAFENKERDERRKFFATSPTGEQKRAYVRGLIDRREVLKRQQISERTRTREESELRISALRKLQDTNLVQFKEELKGGKRPDESLWPH